MRGNFVFYSACLQKNYKIDNTASISGFEQANSITASMVKALFFLALIAMFSYALNLFSLSALVNTDTELKLMAAMLKVSVEFLFAGGGINRIF